MLKNPDLRICLVTFLFNKAFISPLSNLESILSNLTENELYVVEGCFENLRTPDNRNIKKYRILHKQKTNVIYRILKLLYLQLRMSLKLIQLSKDIDVCIFFTGQWEILPLLTAKLLRKKVLWLLPSSMEKMMEYDDNRKLLKYYLYIQKLSFFSSDKIVLHSKNLVKDWDLEGYKSKIVFANEYFVNFNKFKLKKSINQRDYDIGYIGRLSEEKGILNFIHSIPLILNEYPSKKIIIVGDGNLKNVVKDNISKNNLNDNVKFTRWKSPNKIPNLLNEIKLLVIPSYTESGPIIALEAMACGTPILISKVGHVYNLINNGKNGFILENNRHNCIFKNIENILNYFNLNEIAYNGYATVQKEFNYKKTVEKWEIILNDLNVK